MTPRERAELYARVARRIGLSNVQIVAGVVMHDIPKLPLFNESDIGRMAVPFDPVTNPADERRCIEWVFAQPELNLYWNTQTSGVVICDLERRGPPMQTAEEYGEDPCRVTALLLAIATLPEPPA